MWLIRSRRHSLETCCTLHHVLFQDHYYLGLPEFWLLFAFVKAQVPSELSDVTNSQRNVQILPQGLARRLLCGKASLFCLWFDFRTLYTS